MADGVCRSDTAQKTEKKSRPQAVRGKRRTPQTDWLFFVLWKMIELFSFFSFFRRKLQQNLLDIHFRQGEAVSHGRTRQFAFYGYFFLCLSVAASSRRRHREAFQGIFSVRSCELSEKEKVTKPQQFRDFSQRKERDSNPRDAINAYTISSRAPSTSSAIFPYGKLSTLALSGKKKVVRVTGLEPTRPFEH